MSKHGTPTYETLMKDIDPDVLAQYGEKLVKIFLAIKQGMKPPLIFLRYEMEGGKVNKERAEYRCFCGKKFTTKVLNVKQNNTRSCGCYRSFINQARLKKKAKANTRETSACPTKQVWLDLNKDEVVPNWLTFQGFFEDMYFMPNPYDWYLKRRDPLKLYGPSNCVWERRDPLKSIALTLAELIRSGQVTNKPRDT